MPNFEAIRLWVEDLRTTDAPQGKRKLRSGDAFCCLGRACEVYRAHTGKGRWSDTGVFADGEGSGEPLVMPGGVARWLGIEHYEGGACGNPTLSTLDGPIVAAALNDAGVPFAKIADEIERTFLVPDA